MSGITTMHLSDCRCPTPHGWHAHDANDSTKSHERCQPVVMIDPPEEEHETTVLLYDAPSPLGIAGTWKCSCGSGGTSKHPQGAADLHWMRATGVLPKQED